MWYQMCQCALLVLELVPGVPAAFNFIHNTVTTVTNELETKVSGHTNGRFDVTKTSMTELFL